MTQERPDDGRQEAGQAPSPEGGREPVPPSEAAPAPAPGREPPQEARAYEEPSAATAEGAKADRPERASALPPVVARVEEVREPAITRRGILRIGFWTAMGVFLLGTAGAALDLVYPRHVIGFGGKVAAGPVDKFPAGSKTQNVEGHFWLVHLTPDQGGDGLLALWWKCPHLGCTVPWRADFTFTDPNTGQAKKGWFRCPCHGSTYTDAGVRVFGPAPRSMDTMALTVDNGTVNVDTGKVTPGSTDNPSRAVKV